MRARTSALVGVHRAELGAADGGDRVVPGAVPGVGGSRQSAQLAGWNGDSDWIAAGIEGGLDPQPRAVRVEAIVATTTWWLVSGRPGQFMVICENNRCSILFHFEVPGGKWQTAIVRPVSAASAASPAFHNR